MDNSTGSIEKCWYFDADVDSLQLSESQYNNCAFINHWQVKWIRARNSAAPAINSLTLCIPPLCIDINEKPETTTATSNSTRPSGWLLLCVTVGAVHTSAYARPLRLMASKHRNYSMPLPPTPSPPPPSPPASTEIRKFDHYANELSLLLTWTNGSIDDAVRISPELKLSADCSPRYLDQDDLWPNSVPF